MENPRLSKKEKKLLKYQKSKELKQNQKKKNNKAKKEKRAEMLASMADEQRAEFIANEKSSNQILEAEWLRVINEGTPLIFDLSFCSLMNELEINSLITQIAHSIGFLRKNEKQFFKLICCSVSGEVKEKLEKRSGKNWNLQLREEDIDALPELSGKQIIMMSPDAPDPLIDVDLENSVYVIGGLVDRTRKNSITLNKAVQKNFRAYRLPIQEEITQKIRVVLNINTVVEILHKKASGMPWKEALNSSIPQRLFRQVEESNKKSQQNQILTPKKIDKSPKIEEAKN
ncbi:unnamed protein product [Blepharisma stoltei]|uniref:tRNA (guanine(9)-N(1))-methyltransferase n=1 Tax=Blepharisma stoltei TaxID=1481888 RepID=A0AAU9IR99_9CILI|nr:unnamed protein product [Blepharisma stoltei]